MEYPCDAQPCPVNDGVEPEGGSNASSLPTNEQRWELQKDEIYRFYVQENHTLPATMHNFQVKYGLKASVRKWKMVLAAWKFNKNLKTEEMLFVVAKGEKRAIEEGKETAFFYRGTQIKEEKIEKFKRRRITNIEMAGEMDARTPKAITYNTPPPSDHAEPSLNQRCSLMDPPSVDRDDTLAPEYLSTQEHYSCHPGGKRSRYRRDAMQVGPLIPKASLDFMPRSVMQNIVKFVNFEDVFTLGLTCKTLRYLLTEEEVGKRLLQEKVPYSKEARMSMNVQAGYASAFRRVAKRRQSLINATPFACAILGFADSYLYCQGILCYTLDDRLRILDLHNSWEEEAVISIPNLLRHAIPELHDSQDGTFEILYTSSGIVCCLFNSIGQHSRAWLVAFHIESHKMLVTESFDISQKAFARHNRSVLYFGRNSGHLTDGIEKWIIKCYDFERAKWFNELYEVPDIAGSGIGSTICLEVINNALVAVTNRVSSKFEGTGCVSFYSCFSFSPLHDRLEAVAESQWRRNHHTEGPIDDRWTSLNLEIDEAGGFLKIVESRKEWHEGSSASELRYYTTDLAFHEVDFREPQDDTLSTASNGAENTQLSISYLADHQLNPQAADSGSPPRKESPHLTKQRQALLRLLARVDHPLYLPPPLRTADRVHPVRHGSSQATFAHAKAKVRSYSASASTVLYLVDDPLPTDWQGRQRLRLRSDSRSLGPPRQDWFGCWVNYPPCDLSSALETMYISPPVAYWPPAQNPDYDHADKLVDDIYNILNPPAFLGNVRGTTDERSLIYTTGDMDCPQAIVFISFDPAIKLKGLKRWEGNSRQCRSYVDVGDEGRTVTLDQVYRESDTRSKGTSLTGSSTRAVRISNVTPEVKGGSEFTKSPQEGSVDWIWKEKPMYRDIDLGYDFSL